jgi:shikimate dehydrogenase
MISGRTRIFGIFGYPVEHTFSPGMHNAAFQALKMNACYVPFPVAPEHLKAAVQALAPLGLQGVNVTVPHKVRIIPFLDELSREARLVGAVNTVELKRGSLIGHNTDGSGFLRSLREEARFDPRGKDFLCLGSGGAARAVCFSLALAGASRIQLWNRDASKADRLAREIRKRTGAEAVVIRESSLGQAAAVSHCLINATPLGLKKTDPLPVAADLIDRSHLVCDLVYNPRITPFLKAAMKKKARTLPGLGMLLFQGVTAFEIWTGKKAPVEVMRRALVRQVLRR